MSSRWQDADVTRGADYDARWQELIDSGQNIHGEADLVALLLADRGGGRMMADRGGGREKADRGGGRVLDAGCGTGRVAIELAARGMSVTGVDADPQMLSTAQAKAPESDWAQCDLADAGRLAAVAPGPFDLVLLAGNVMVFLEPGTERQVLVNLADRLAPGGLLVAGFSLLADLTLERYDDLAGQAGLHLMKRWATWDRVPFDGGEYAVSVHRR